MPRCKVCNTKFTPQFSSFQKTCGTECALEYGRKKAAQEWIKEKKIEHKSVGKWLVDLQRVFNTWIRYRDKGQGCISCGIKDGVQFCAGHFYTVQSAPSLRFHPDNVNLQCNRRCNMELSGNIQNYRPALIKKIGEERFSDLERMKNTPLRLTIPEIQEKIQYYREQIKILKSK